MGRARAEFLGKPVIAILNTWSDLSPCHSHLRQRADAVKRGVWQAGGYPVELPALSVGEVMVKPTTMLYRNFLAMECEELLRQHPVDGAVLMGGCDKSTPALLMGATSMNIPALFCPAGFMSSGRWRGTKVGAGTHTRSYWDELQVGNITPDDWLELEGRMTRSTGTCNTMGTASTMTSIADALGMLLAGASSIPACDSLNEQMAAACGARAVEMVWEDLKPRDILNADAFHNGLVAYMALGGSTNAAIHLIAMARRAGVEMTLDQMNDMAGQIPVIANLFPSGENLMEDFFFAGGLKALLAKVKDQLKLDAMTVNGKTMGENLEAADCYDDDVIRDVKNPVVPLSKGRTLCLLRGNLAPDGAVMKSSAASPRFFKHEGRAVVFEGPGDMKARINDPDLEIDEETVLVMRGGGPVGAPGMPEWGNLLIPTHLLKKGVRDLVRISDARMSGTHYGSCILHVSPEAAVGGPLALIETGDRVRLDIEAGTLDMLVDDAELARRRAAWSPPETRFSRSYAALHQAHVTQAHEGCDYDFLSGTDAVPEPDIY